MVKVKVEQTVFVETETDVSLQDIGRAIEESLNDAEIVSNIESATNRQKSYSVVNALRDYLLLLRGFSDKSISCIPAATREMIAKNLREHANRFDIKPKLETGK